MKRWTKILTLCFFFTIFTTLFVSCGPNINAINPNQISTNEITDNNDNSENYHKETITPIDNIKDEQPETKESEDTTENDGESQQPRTTETSTDADDKTETETSEHDDTTTPTDTDSETEQQTSDEVLHNHNFSNDNKRCECGEYLSPLQSNFCNTYWYSQYKSTYIVLELNENLFNVYKGTMDCNNQIIINRNNKFPKTDEPYEGKYYFIISDNQVIITLDDSYHGICLLTYTETPSEESNTIYSITATSFFNKYGNMTFTFMGYEVQYENE
ncbi:MAG: hypothetical protein MJ054_01015 [Clostridia bacterium]|nr:hypothetical protein [Clostridia bacterium]